MVIVCPSPVRADQEQLLTCKQNKKDFHLWTGTFLALSHLDFSYIYQRMVVNGNVPRNGYAQFSYTPILGPPFFYFVYINDPFVNLGCDVHLFADDTSLLDCFNDYAE